jgi:hypothetical protein
MPYNPTVSELHQSAPLTDISIAFGNADTNSVHDKVFPVVPVAKQADKYYVWDRQDFMRSDAEARAPGAEAHVGGPRLSRDSYLCERVAIARDISDPERANADPAVSSLDADATEWVTEQIRLKNEIDWNAAYFTTGVWTGASSTSDMTGQAAPASTAANFLQWDDVASTPILDLRGEFQSIMKNAGRKPNKLVLGQEVWTVLQDHEDVLDRIKYSERGVITEDLIAGLLGVEQVHVASMTQDTAVEGAAGSFSFVNGKAALLCYSAPTPGLRRPTAGYSFVWTMSSGAQTGARIKRYRLERNESDRIEGERWIDYKVVSSVLGAFFTSAIS